MLGIVSDSEFELEIDRLNGIVEKGEIREISRGRGHGNKEVPEILREVIAENAIQEGNKATKALTHALGISDSSLSAYKNGATSTTTYHESNEELKKSNNEVKERILNLSRERLIQAITHISEEKLESAKARDLAGIAKDMSAVVRNLEPDNEIRKDTPPLVIFAPQIRDEKSYEILQLNE